MERNELYPIFLKLHQLNVLIVGGGNVGLEKASFLLKSSPNANVEIVAPRFLPELETLSQRHPSVKLTHKKFNRWMLRKRHMVIACTDDLKVNKRIYELSRKRCLICNIADTPDLCDYYLGSHQLLLLNYYPYIARFLAPHQREVRSHIEKIEKQDFNAGMHQISGWQDNRP